jgi:cytochrome c
MREKNSANLMLVAMAGLSLLAGSLTSETAVAQSSPVRTAALNGDPARGETLDQGCMDCHSIDKNDVGPMHRGVVGRRAGIVAGYAYSKALKNSGLTWDEPTLDRWLIDPGALVPDTKMFYAVEIPQDRADIIAYLKQQK